MMRQEQRINTANESNETIFQRTHKAAFIGSIGVASALYAFNEDNDIPHSTVPLLDAPEHVKHLAPGMLLGFGFKTLAERLHKKLNQYRTAISIASVTLVGGLFETQVSDLLWYRNTTKDFNDVVYTVLAGVVGALCLRNKKRGSKNEPPFL